LVAIEFVVFTFHGHAGVAVGAGWQSIVAYVNIACYYLVGVPVGAVLGYAFNMDVKVSSLLSPLPPFIF
jgi:Na+-driven multidrug efflux pump